MRPLTQTGPVGSAEGTCPEKPSGGLVSKEGPEKWFCVVDEGVGAEWERDLDVEERCVRRVRRKKSSWPSVRTRGMGVRPEAEGTTATSQSRGAGCGAHRPGCPGKVLSGGMM